MAPDLNETATDAAAHVKDIAAEPTGHLKEEGQSSAENVRSEASRTADVDRQRPAACMCLGGRRSGVSQTALAVEAVGESMRRSGLPACHLIAASGPAGGTQ